MRRTAHGQSPIWTLWFPAEQGKPVFYSHLFRRQTDRPGRADVQGVCQKRVNGVSIDHCHALFLEKRWRRGCGMSRPKAATESAMTLFSMMEYYSIICSADSTILYGISMSAESAIFAFMITVPRVLLMIGISAGDVPDIIFSAVWAAQSPCSSGTFR